MAEPSWEQHNKQPLTLLKTELHELFRVSQALKEKLI